MKSDFTLSFRMETPWDSVLSGGFHLRGPVGHELGGLAKPDSSLNHSGGHVTLSQVPDRSTPLSASGEWRWS